MPYTFEDEAPDLIDQLQGKSTSSSRFVFEDEPVDMPTEEIAPSVQADIDSATPKVAEPIVAPKEESVVQPTAEPKKGLFDSFVSAWRGRTSNIAKDIDENIYEPFKADKTAGGEELQRAGDVGARIGGTAIGMIDAGTTAPVASAAEVLVKPLIKPAAKGIEWLAGGDPRFKAERVTDEAVNKIAKDFGDVFSIAALAPRPLTEVGSVARKADAARELAREQTKAKLQDMGYDVSGLGTKTAQQNTKANLEVAEALGANKTNIAFAYDVALPLTDTQKTVLSNMEMKVRAINGTAPEQSGGGLIDTTLNKIDEEIKKYESKENFNPEKVKQLEAEKQIIIDSNKTPQAQGGTVNQIRKGIDEEIAKLEAEKASTLEVYHVTTNPELTFQKGKGELGTHLASTTDQANAVIKSIQKSNKPGLMHKKESINVHPVTATIKNPIKLYDQHGWDTPGTDMYGLLYRDGTDRFGNSLGKAGKEAGLTEADVPAIKQLYTDRYNKDIPKEQWQDSFWAFLKSKGFDAIKYENQFEDAGTISYIVPDASTQLKSTIANKASKQDLDSRIAQLKAERDSVTTKRELPPISPSQFESDILVPAAEALDYGVPAKVVQDRIVENLLIANRSPEEITDIVEAVMSNNTRISLSPEIKTSLNKTPIQVPRREGFAIGDYISSNAGRKLVSAQEVDEIFGSLSSKLTTKFVDDFAYQTRISRAYSKKNGNIFGDTENLLRDDLLNRISAVRDTNSNPFQSWIIGDHRGQVNALIDGIQQPLTGVKPLRNIYDDAAKLGLDAERAKKLHLAANAVSDIKNIEKDISKYKQLIADKTEALSNATDTHIKNSIRGEIRKAENEIKLLEAKDVYRVDPSNPLSGKEQAMKIMELDGQTDAGKQFLADMKTYSDSLLELAVRGGKITSGEAKAMREANTNYLYTFRDRLADIPDDLKFGTVKSASKGTATVFKKRDISAQDIYEDPMSAMTMYTAKLTNQAHKAEESYYTLMHNLERLDERAFNKIFEQDKNLVIEALMGKRDKTGKPITKYDADQLIKDRDPRKPVGEANWTVYTPEGTRLDLTVRPEYSGYLRSLLRPRLYIEPSAMGRLVRDIKQRTTNFATTYNPFLQLQFTAASRLGYRASVAKDLRGKGELSENLRDVALKMYQDPEFKDYIKRNISAGALNRSGEGMSRTELAKHEIARSLKNEKGIITNAVDVAKKPFLYLEDFADTMDNLNRGKVYLEVKNTLMKEGKMTPHQIELAAINAAKNFEVNYFRQGSSTNFAWRGLTYSIPFMQTGIKGGVKAVVALKHRPKEVATAIGMLAGAEFAVNSYNAQFTDEKGVPYYSYVDPSIREKYILMGWPGMTSPSQFMKIRRPFNLGRVSGGAQEAAFMTLNRAATNIVNNAEADMKTALENNPIFSTYLRSGTISEQDVTAIVLNQLTADFDPTRYMLQNVAGFGVVGEMMMNQQDFQVPIVSDKTSNLAQYQQVAPGRTSPLVYNFSRYLASKGIEDVNPTMTTYFIENFYGNLGKQLLGAADVIYAHSTGKELPETPIESYPGISAFSTLREVPPTGIKRMYGNVNRKAQSLYEEYTKEMEDAKKGGSINSKQAQKLLVENRDVFDFYLGVLEPINKQIAELNARRTQLLGFGSDRRKDDTTPEIELMGDPILRDKINSIDKDIQNLQAIALDEVYQRKDELKDLYMSRNNLSLPAKFLNAIIPSFDSDKKPVDKPKKKEYNIGPQSNLETYDDSNPPSITEQFGRQFGMDLQPAAYVEQVDYKEPSQKYSVFELLSDEGAKPFNPKDVKIIPGPEEPINSGKIIKKEFPNIEKKFPKAKELDVKLQKTGDDYFAKLAFAESTNNPNAASKTSTAKGTYQFTIPTWNSLASSPEGKKAGLTRSGIFNPKQQEIAVRLFTAKNKKELAAKLKLPESKLDHTALYAAHHFGATGAAKLLTAPYNKIATKVLPDVVDANKSIFYDKENGNKPRTVKEVIKLLEKKMKPKTQAVDV